MVSQADCPNTPSLYLPASNANWVEKNPQIPVRTFHTRLRDEARKRVWQ